MIFINPAAQRINEFKKALQAQDAGAAPGSLDVVPASTWEFQQLQKIKRNRISRIKMVGSREALLSYSGALADSLAAQARKFGVQVKEVSLENSSINGRYFPASRNAIETLDGLAAVRWEDLSDPLDLPLLKIPSVEVRMTLISSCSRIAPFIQSLPNFSSLVQLTELHAEENALIYHMKILGYYYSLENLQQTAQLNAPSYR
jgi:hypothetical protein